MTMHINLSPEMETFIKGKVASGFYGNATEVIRDALRRMQAEETRVQAGKPPSGKATTKSSTVAKASGSQQRPRGQMNPNGSEDRSS